MTDTDKRTPPGDEAEDLTDEEVQRIVGIASMDDDQPDPSPFDDEGELVDAGALADRILGQS